jgi:hypothetical protein
MITASCVARITGMSTSAQQKVLSLLSLCIKTPNISTPLGGRIPLQVYLVYIVYYTTVYLDCPASRVSRSLSPVCQTLEKDLRDLQIEEGGLLQHVDDLLSFSTTWYISDANTVLVLNFLADTGYKVSKKKNKT